MKRFIVVYLLLCLVAPTAIMAEKQPFGNGLFWELNNGTLTISGNGEMPNTLVPWYGKEATITKIVIEYGVSTISDMAFHECKSLTHVTLPNSMMSIGKSAFSDCTNLAFVEIPNSVTSIGKSAFSGCTNLQDINITGSIRSIEEQTFYGCTKLYLITLPNSVTSIGSLAFCNCERLSIVTLPTSLISIGKSAFQNCIGLTSINIPNSVTSIGKGAFALCSGLTSITIPNSVTSIGERAFALCSGLLSINIPNSVTSIGESAFTGETAFSYYKGRIVSIPQWLINKGLKEWERCGLSEESVNAYKTGKKLYSPTIIKAEGGYASAVELMNGSTKYYKVSKGGRYGLTNSEGKVIIPCEMESLEQAGTGFLRFKLNGFYGIVNYAGKIIIPTDRGYTKIGDYVSFTKRFPYEMDGWKGECNNLGVQVSKIKVNKPVAQQSIGSSSSSKTSNDLATFDLKGNVKKCVMGSDTREFDRNGKLIVSGNQEIIYDNKGRISEIKVGIDGLGGGFKYEYDNNGRVKIEISLLSILGNTAEVRDQFFYNNKGQIVKCYLTTNGGAEQTIIYSDYEYDSHGNWISRKKNGNTETRTIEYY